MLSCVAAASGMKIYEDTQRSIEEITDDILAEMFDINIKGAYVATRSVIPGMKMQKSVVVYNMLAIGASRVR